MLPFPYLVHAKGLLSLESLILSIGPGLPPSVLPLYSHHHHPRRRSTRIVPDDELDERLHSFSFLGDPCLSHLIAMLSTYELYPMSTPMPDTADPATGRRIPPTAPSLPSPTECTPQPIRSRVQNMSLSLDNIPNNFNPSKVERTFSNLSVSAPSTTHLECMPCPTCDKTIADTMAVSRINGSFNGSQSEIGRAHV